MKKRRIKIIPILFLIFFFFLISVFVIYKYEIGAVSKDTETIEFEVPKGSTYLSLAPSLKENHLIKSEFFYKLYIRIHKPTKLEAGIYPLNQTMDLSELISEFEKGNTYNPYAVTLQVPEGKYMEQVAEYAAAVTNHTKEELLEVWDSEEFVNEVIEKYWFVTDEVLNSALYHPLEGYFFPSTYELTNADVSSEYIAYKMLDEMGHVLEQYKKEIEASEYSTHELLTMASLVEYEAILDEDRALIAGVFYNRLKVGMKLQSCVTLGYATGTWKLTYSMADINTDSPYNTYYYTGLPIGPGGMPGKKSIEAAIFPEETDYYYFMANVCDPESKKTYFSKTLSEHEAYVRKYLTCF